MIRMLKAVDSGRWTVDGARAFAIARVCFAAMSLCCVLAIGADAETSEEITNGKKPWILAQEKGLVQGSFTPWKRGLNLPPAPKVLVIPLNAETSKSGGIDDWQALFVQRRLKMAERDKCDLVVLEIDSYGGELEACERITQALAASKVPVIAFVKNKALSGGAVLALGCRMIVMQPGSDIGSAKAINLNGDLAQAMRQKIDGHMRALVSNLCDQNGHPRALAQGMVDSSIEVIETDDSARRFMTDSEFAAAEVRGASAVRKWKSKDQILSLTAAEARGTGLASGIAANLDELMLGLQTPGAPQNGSANVVRADISASENVARILSDPLWRMLLVIAGLIGLFLELKSPGHGFGYAGFAICMGFFFWLQIFQQNAGILELSLFAAGSVLVALELFVLPTFGALGFAGIAGVIVSIVLAFLPEGSFAGLTGSSGKPPEYLMKQIVSGMEWAALTLLSVIGFFLLVWWKGVQLPGFNRLSLQRVNAGTIGDWGAHHSRAAASLENPGASAVGKIAVVETVLRPAGKIRLEGNTYDAVSEGEFIDAGKKVRVLRSQGYALVVRASDDGALPPI